MLITNTFFWVKIIELINGLICYSLKTYYVDGVVETIKSVLDDDSRTLGVRMDLLSVSTVAFPFIILLGVIISYVVHGKDTDKNIMIVLFSWAGFIAYLSSGIFILQGASFNGDGYTGAMATGVMCVINSVMFLFDAILALFCTCIQN